MAGREWRQTRHFNPNDRLNDEVGMTDDTKAKRVDLANEPVDVDDDDEMVDTGVLHPKTPKKKDDDAQE